MMQLCDICNAANGNSFQEGECHICRGGFRGTEGMIAEASALLKKESASSFSISTLIPKDYLAREEKAWDIRLSGAESVKNHINRLVSSRLSALGPRYDKDGQVRLTLDFQERSVSLQRGEIFVFGRYRKISPGISQSRWICSACQGKGCPRCGGKGKMYDSVEERIGEPLKEASGADGYVLHASGREDVDATNSAGRPFVMELKGPKHPGLDLEAVSGRIAGSGDVAVSGLRVVDRAFVELVTESHFDKSYEAEVEFGREITEADAERIRSIEGKTLLQQTPTRVAHRRADLVRHRKVKHLETVDVSGARARLIVKAEAGTYIKELISGDGGRTKPSVAGILETGASCTKLNVSMIDDIFLDFVLEART